MTDRCPNPYCDGYGWITAGATGTANAYSVPVCKVGPHPHRETSPSAVPPCFRGNVAVSLAYEQGAKAGAAGLSRDYNPYDPFNRLLCAAWDEGWCDGRDTLSTEKE